MELVTADNCCDPTGDSVEALTTLLTPSTRLTKISSPHTASDEALEAAAGIEGGVQLLITHSRLTLVATACCSLL